MYVFLLCVLFFLFGIFVVLFVQWYFIYHKFCKLPPETPTSQSAASAKGYLRIPKELKELLRRHQESRDKPETCVALNLLVHFLFQESRDTKKLRQWVMRKITVEMEELLQNTAVGRFLEQITVRDLFLGNHVPIVHSICVQNMELDSSCDIIEELNLVMEVEYTGNFQLSIDADMVLGRRANVCVCLSKLQGRARLQFTRKPYTHWDFCFLEDPIMDLRVQSQFQGKSLQQVTSIIANQIRRSVRKKHTFPNYKIRYKPFFAKSGTAVDENVYLSEQSLAQGRLQVNVIGCSRLFSVNYEAAVYCTLSIDSIQCAHSRTNQLFNRSEMSSLQSTSEAAIGPTAIAKATIGQNEDLNKCINENDTSVGDCQRSKQDSAPNSAAASPAGSPQRRSSAAANRKLSESESSPSGPKTRLRRTSLAKSFVGPSWNETFEFDVRNRHKYLNVCVWAKLVNDVGGVARTGDPSLVLPPPSSQQAQNRAVCKDGLVMVGVANIHLVEVALECACTSIGFMKRTFRLSSPEPNNTASRHQKLSSHPGFDQSMCYGDITLAFVHTPGQSHVYDGCADEAEQATDALDEMDYEPNQTDMSDLGRDLECLSLENEHDFVGTRFQSSTMCNVCGKKIWLKVAFQCKKCAMISHKKCVARSKQKSPCYGKLATGDSDHDSPDKESNLNNATTESTMENLPIIVTRPVMDDSAKFEKSFSHSEIQVPPSVFQNQRRSIPNILANIASQVKNTAVSTGSHLVRTGSGHNLTLPGTLQGSDQLSRSLPPSPATSRKGSVQMSVSPFSTPVFCVDGNERSVEETLQRLLRLPNDVTIVSTAKEMGAELFADLPSAERRNKLDVLMNKVKTTLDFETSQLELFKQQQRAAELTGDVSRQREFGSDVSRCDERIQALALLMVHYCAALQHCQETEHLRNNVEFNHSGRTLTEFEASNSSEEMVNSLERDSTMATILDQADIS